jgi:transcriptional regulator with XRE-family HTH domain
MVSLGTVKLRAKKIGVLIKDARLSAGKSMKDCANVIGVSSSRISAFERGDKTPSLPELEALAYYLEMPLENFWSSDMQLRSKFEEDRSANLDRLVALRTRVVGVLLRKARIDADITLTELAETVDITTRRLKSYEAGNREIPLPELEVMANHLDLSIDYFRDEEGIIGKWSRENKSIQQFLDLPPDMQDFVTTPLNLPYLEIAEHLSGMSVEKLRALAEGLLEITL